MSKEETLVHNKSIKVGDPSFIEALFPQYKLREELVGFDTTERVFYKGKVLPNIRKRLQESYKSYIILSSVGEVKLETNTELLDFVYSKYDKEPTKKVREFCESLDITELLGYLKVFGLQASFPYLWRKQKCRFTNCLSQSLDHRLI